MSICLSILRGYHALPSERVIVSMDVIATQGATNWVLARLGKRHGGGGGGGSPSLMGKERAGELEGTCIQSMFESIDVTLP